jgi:hypothetical protein
MPAVSGVAVAAMLLLTAGQAQAATTVYPAGGSTFTGGAEGWTVKSASCNVPALCTASGGYEAGNGNPAGSLAANSNITLTLLSLFKSTVVLQSPEFTAGATGSATLRLDRQFAPGGLLALAPQVNYTVALVDTTAGTEAKPLTETVTGESGFTGKEAAVPVTSGHSYVIAITSETSSTLVGTGLLAGSTSARFDNVALSVQTPGGNGGGGNGGDGGAGGNGASGLSNSQLTSLIQSSLPTSAVLKGNRLFVKVKCPAKIGRACHISGQGMLTKSKTATTRRTVKVAKGKAKQIVLKVKPAAKKTVAKAKRILFRETVKAGSAKATAYSHLKLIRR